jgi:hypothetical protein
VLALVRLLGPHHTEVTRAAGELRDHLERMGASGVIGALDEALTTTHHGIVPQVPFPSQDPSGVNDVGGPKDASGPAVARPHETAARPH